MLAKSFRNKFLDKIDFSVNDISAIRKIGELRGRQDLNRHQAPRALASLARNAIIESAESSSLLDGITAPRGRIESLVVGPARPASQSEEEIAGYRDALSLIHQSAAEMQLSIGVILQLHAALYRAQPGVGGQWKKSENQLVKRNPDGSVDRIRFKPVPPDEVPQSMDDLVAGYKRAVANKREPLVLVPLAILDFLCIHPFAEGNGRTSRLLMLLLLSQFDFEVGRYVSIERVIEDSKEKYFTALEASTRGWHDGKHDPHPWMLYCWGVLITAHNELEQSVGSVNIGPGAKTAQIERAVRRRDAPFSISDIELECPDVSHEMVRHVLRQMRTRGEVESSGRGRGAKWVTKPR
jgi:Fic family protein